MSGIEIGMMVAFVLALGFSAWKLYAFMPNKPLADDDTNTDATHTLKEIMYEVIGAGHIEEETIVTKMQEHPRFDAEHFWRFNLNRLRQLLNSHYIEHPEHEHPGDIHEHLKKNAEKQDHNS